LLVGATAYAGNLLASYLLAATVILAGRNKAKLDELQSGLRQQASVDRTELLVLDAANPDSVMIDPGESRIYPARAIDH